MFPESLKAAVIITAAGSSKRMGPVSKKEFLKIDNSPVLLLSIKPFVESGLFYKYIIILPEKDINNGKAILGALPGGQDFIYTSGGLTRQESVFNGLLALERESPDIVLIHDGARPWITDKLIISILNKVKTSGAAIPVIPSVNAMKTINTQGTVIRNLKREFTVAAQTPQGFSYREILESHKKAAGDGIHYIDDAEIYSKYSGNVETVRGDSTNRKITYPSDIKGK